jgi:CHAD domain-containing protein
VAAVALPRGSQARYTCNDAVAELFIPSGILRKRVDALTDELQQVPAGDVEAIHRTRVAIRRLRELLPIAVADRQTARELGRRLRDANRVLGPVRELDVLGELVADLQRERWYSADALRSIGRAVKGARRKAGKRLEPCARKLGKLATPIEDVIADLDSRGVANLRKVRRDWLWAVQARVVHRACRMQSAMDRAGVLYASGPLHDVRVAIKKLRYTIELSDECGDVQPGAVNTLKGAQDLLGRQHDLDTLLMWGRQVQASATRHASWRELAALTRAIEGDCRELHARYIRERAALTALVVRAGANASGVVVDGQRAVRPASSFAS